MSLLHLFDREDRYLQVPIRLGPDVQYALGIGDWMTWYAVLSVVQASVQGFDKGETE